MRAKWIKKELSDGSGYWFEWDTPYGVYHADEQDGCWLMRCEDDFKGLFLTKKRGNIQNIKRFAVRDAHKRNSETIRFIVE